MLMKLINLWRLTKVKVQKAKTNQEILLVLALTIKPT